MSIDACVFKIDPSGPICTDNDLQLRRNKSRGGISGGILVPCHTTGSCMSQLVPPLEGCMSHKGSWNISLPDSQAKCHRDTPQTRHGQQSGDSRRCFGLAEASSSVQTISCGSPLKEHQLPCEQLLNDQGYRHQRQWPEGCARLGAR